MAEGFTSSEDQQTLKDILALSKDDPQTPRSEEGNILPAFENLIHQIVYYATGEDSNWDHPPCLLQRAKSLWLAGERRPQNKDTVFLRVEEGTEDSRPRLVLEVVTEDKPFVVDSISGALTDAGRPVSFFVNAVIDLHRDADGVRSGSGDLTAHRESMIRAEMDPPVDENDLEELRTEIETVLADITLAVDDWEPMRARLAASIAQLERARPAGVDREDLRESIEFLKWIWDNRFAFLGVRRYLYTSDKSGKKFQRDESGDLGIVRDLSKRILKSTYAEDGTPSAQVLHFMQSGEPILVSKANVKSTVHRRVHMDYIGVKIYSVDGTVQGEDRFVGLFTAEAYNRPASDIPLFRSKVIKIAEGAGFLPGGHNEKAIVNILETYPRDELFQTDIETLRGTALGILRLFKRPRTKLFIRRDRFNRFVSALAYVPRDRFSSDVREEIGKILCDAYGGWLAAFSPYFGDAALVRVHYIIGIDTDAPEGPGVVELTRKIREVTRNWEDDLLDTMRRANQGSLSTKLFSKYIKSFDIAYQERNSAEQAVSDIDAIEKLGDQDIDLSVYRSSDEPDSSLHIRLFSRNLDFQLSDLIPTMENLGLRAITEKNYELQNQETFGRIAINDFYVEDQFRRTIDLEAVSDNLREAFLAVLNKNAEDDSFNALVVTAGITWREASVLRAAAKHALQTGFSASQAYIAETLSKHANITKMLVDMFHARFDPVAFDEVKDREQAENAKSDEIVESLKDVSSLDEDKIIRRYVNFIKATTRTNFYQVNDDNRPKAYLSLKIDTKKLQDVPDPKPFREIFVASPTVDGVHLRFGAVARGGLRWSDRREDFRTEVLGLVKAQRVKNAVIVPAGAKGCFYPKNIPIDGDRAAVYEAGRTAYIEFVKGLLDVTDNIVEGDTIPPKNVVCWDAPDPYLVVAADKGTASFSDTANGVSEAYGFWLGDAFASGGSEGYDHKVMGITARGGWEAVKRHFREIGKDIQSEEFSVVGVGDMSGDVFGNGMLLSTKIQLIAAFDHRDIFIDPSPNADASFKERQRLFDTPRSTWQDYDASLISKGGGVFSRSLKSIPITPEMQTAFDTNATALTPNELIKTILKAKVELLWMGGIGTYFKDKNEENWRVGDRANDPVRIDADEMRVLVVGEGANLGLTQRARIAFARNGGRINTDAIDNSAGVDSSDHEVNIKILLSSAIERGSLAKDDRSALLRDMTENVAEHVLRNNYEQTLAITLMESNAARDLDAHARLMGLLEREGRLKRDVEDLPDEKRIAAMRADNRGLTRPDLSVLLAYAKMQIFDELLESNVVDDAALETELVEYFPEQLRNFDGALEQHRLRREIIATRLSNDLVNTCGAAFASRVSEATGADLPQIVLTYEAARRTVDLSGFARKIDQLDNSTPADVQTGLYCTASTLISEVVYQTLRGASTITSLERGGLSGFDKDYGAAFAELRTSLVDLLSPRGKATYTENKEAWLAHGLEEKMADEAATLPFLYFGLPIISLARRIGWSPVAAGLLFFAVGNTFDIDTAYRAARSLILDKHFDRLAMRRLTDGYIEQQEKLATNIALFADQQPDVSNDHWSSELIGQWRENNDGAINQYEEYVDRLDLETGLGVGKASLFGQKLLDLVERTTTA